MSRKAKILQRSDWARDDKLWHGRFEGSTLGTDVTVLFFESEKIGSGPPLHTHPYDEVFIVRQGRARFTLCDEKVDADAGMILLAPKGMPHKFENLGPGRLETTDIHLSAKFIQTEVTDPDGTEKK